MHLFNWNLVPEVHTFIVQSAFMKDAAFPKQMRGISSIKTLILYHMDLSNMTFSAEDYPSLQHLEIERCTLEDPHRLPFEHLTTLIMKHVPMTRLPELPHPENLTHLELINCLPQDFVSNFKPYPHLQKGELRFHPLELPHDSF